MTLNPPTPFRNLLLRSLPQEAVAKLAPFLHFVSLGVREAIEAPGQRIESVYFFETALASTVARAGTEEVEVCITGRDGINGLALVNGTDRSPFECFIQVPGAAYRIGTRDFLALLDEVPDLKRVFLLASQASTIQIAYTSLANGRYSIIERMARWILMCHDRLDGDQLELTHSFLSLMLGVRRAGVTTDMHILEGAHAVVNRRGRIVVRDRAKLEEFAGDCYGAPEAEYERLIGQKLRREVNGADPTTL
jgi:CRP-like cAMP-binding protein